MFALVARQDPGLLVLPTHRAIRGLNEAFSLDALIEAAGAFSWRRHELGEVDLRRPEAFLRRQGAGAMGFLGGDPTAMWVGRLTDADAMARACPEALPAWRELDVAVLHTLIVDGLLARWRTEELFIDYTPDAAEVATACAAGRAQLGALLQPTSIESVEAIACAGATMPHKSTYFYPKLATGMVLKPLE
jgi:hypothetical protein